MCSPNSIISRSHVRRPLIVREYPSQQRTSPSDQFAFFGVKGDVERALNFIRERVGHPPKERARGLGFAHAAEAAGVLIREPTYWHCLRSARIKLWLPNDARTRVCSARRGRRKFEPAAACGSLALCISRLNNATTYPVCIFTHRVARRETNPTVARALRTRLFLRFLFCAAIRRSDLNFPLKYFRAQS